MLKRELPLTTSWKISEGVPVAVKFSVAETLEVTVAEERPRKLKGSQLTDEPGPGENNIRAKRSRLEDSTSLNLTSTPSATSVKDVRPTKIDFGLSDDLSPPQSRYIVPTINFEYNRLKLQVPIELMMMGLR